MVIPEWPTDDARSAMATNLIVARCSLKPLVDDSPAG
jgi:hypothetical protein